MYKLYMVVRNFKSVLVTGGAGFIGSHFVDLCLSKGIKVLNYDAMKTGSNPAYGPERQQEGYTFKHIDITKDNYEIPDDIEAVVHFAAETHVDRSIDDAIGFVEANILGTLNLLKKCQGKAIWFHLVSTDEVYGDVFGTINPSVETDMTYPSSPYSASKAGAESLVIAWARTYSLKATITRGCNTIGPRQNPEKLFPKFIQCASEGLPLTVYGDGTAIRQYIHVKDHASAIYTVLTVGVPDGIYNVCSNATYSINQIVDFMKDRFPNLTTTDKEDRLGHDMLYWIDNRRILNSTQWRPKYTGKDVLTTAFDEIYNQKIV